MFTGQAWFPEYELELCRAYGVPNLGLGAFRGENLSEAAVNDIVIERHNQAAIEAARESFTAASTRAGIKAEPLTVSASLVSAGDQFAQIARRFDLAVVGQPEPEATRSRRSLSKALCSIPAGRSSSFLIFRKRRSSWTV